MTRHLLSAGLLLGMLALTPVAASATPQNDGRNSTSVRGNVYERGNVHQRGNRDSFRDRDSYAFRARHARESRRFFSRGFWFRDRDDRRR